MRKVVATIAKRWRMLAFDYLWERLPEQGLRTVLQLVQDFSMMQTQPDIREAAPATMPHEA